MFRVHQRPTAIQVEARRERYERRQALLRVRVREELLVFIDSLRSCSDSRPSDAVPEFNRSSFI